ncbi:MAG: hypothetical protein QXT35_01540 [Conexivisphaerales archaeon]
MGRSSASLVQWILLAKVFGDSAYDSRDNFNSVRAMGAEPVIKPNSTGKSKSYVKGS